jgi:hypothetical protein
MVCQTIKTGTECAFMTKKGCGFNGGSCHTITERCGGCNKVIDCQTGQYCKVYPEPTSKWFSGNCPTATHIKREITETVQKINPLKASKRSSKH